MKVLFIGDVFGTRGMEALYKYLPEVKNEYKPNLIFLNGENIDKGFGISEKIYKELMVMGVNAVTLGNHSFSKKELVVSMASCTTNCLAPVTQVFKDNFGIKKADELNKKDVGKTRTFAFNGMQDIEVVKYTNNIPFLKEQKGNAFGSFKKDRFVILHLNQKVAHFFKRESLFSDDAYELIDEELDGITIKMYYNQEFEIVKIVQQWMPNITIQNNLELKNKIYGYINKNLTNLLNS